jgi:hypothetical protein
LIGCGEKILQMLITVIDDATSRAMAAFYHRGTVGNIKNVQYLICR